METKTNSNFVTDVLSKENTPWKCISVCLDMNNCFLKPTLVEKISCRDTLYKCVQECKKSMREYYKIKNNH